MTTPLFGQAKKPVERDGRGRPRIVCLDGKTRSYTRVTTFIDCLEDKTSIARWGERNVLVGALAGTAANRTALSKSVAAAVAMGDDGKKTLNELVDKAKTIAGSSDKADEGTANHSLTELLDSGRELPAGLDPTTVADMDAYQLGMRGLTSLGIEEFVVNDDYLCAGTFDRVLRVEPGFDWPEWLVGRHVVGDLKTGRVDYGLLKMAMQLGVYANSNLYDTSTFARTPLGLDLTVGLILHLPVGAGRLDVYALDIAAGYRQVELARQVRAHRATANRTKEFSQLLRSTDAKGVAASTEVAA